MPWVLVALILLATVWCVENEETVGLLINIYIYIYLDGYVEVDKYAYMKAKATRKFANYPQSLANYLCWQRHPQLTSLRDD